MPKRATGRYERATIAGEDVAAFIPFALAPADPPRAAEQALIRLGAPG